MMLCGGGSGSRSYRAASRVNFRWIGVRKREEEGGCGYKDKLLPVVLMCLWSRRVRDIAKRQLWGYCEQLGGFLSLVRGRATVSRDEGNYAHALWEEIIWEVYKGGKYWF
ncbi:hypothetical protein GCM10020331_091620 [Ectobacillus funiculus]